MSSMNDYVEGVKGMMEGVKESVAHLISEENIESMAMTIKSMHEHEPPVQLQDGGGCQGDHC
jgi:predicted Rossmann-fold nucleotide-binding protein